MKIYPGKFFLSVILLLTFKPLAGQIIVNGKILNRDTKEAIAYANIGIPNENIGTISNLDGSFSLVVPKKFENDSLLFSALGYKVKNVLCKSISTADFNVFLEEKIIELKSVTIKSTNSKNKLFELGNSDFIGGVIETDTAYAGRSLALLIDNRLPLFHKDFEWPVYLLKARIRVYRNNLKSFKFRVRINDVDSLTQLPTDDLLHESMVEESAIKKGWLEFDFSVLRFQVEKPFFVTFEQILDKNDRSVIAEGYQKLIQEHPKDVITDTIFVEGSKHIVKKLAGRGMNLPGVFVGIASASKNYVSCTRETSLGEWKKVRGILTATVTLSNQPLTMP